MDTRKDVVTMFKNVKENQIAPLKRQDHANLLVNSLLSIENVHVNGVQFLEMHSKRNVVAKLEDVKESNVKLQLKNVTMLDASFQENGLGVAEKRNMERIQQEKDVAIIKNNAMERNVKH
jgi:hypothetical protein